MTWQRGMMLALESTQINRWNRIFWKGLADKLIVLPRDSLENYAREIVKFSFPFLTAEIPDNLCALTVIITNFV